jgi:hypothetical protein
MIPLNRSSDDPFKITFEPDIVKPYSKQANNSHCWHFLERVRLVLLEAESFIRRHAFYQKSVLEEAKSAIKQA